MSETFPIRLATASDLAPLRVLVESAYRGDSARRGWTHEADLLTGERTSADALAAVLADPRERILAARDRDRIVGCVQISDLGRGACYLGLLCVDPALQAEGLGKQLILEAEWLAVELFGATRMEMTVIDRRPELIAYYERRGYVATGEKRPFPVAVLPPLSMTVLAKPIGRAVTRPETGS